MNDYPRLTRAEFDDKIMGIGIALQNLHPDDMRHILMSVAAGAICIWAETLSDAFGESASLEFGIRQMIRQRWDFVQDKKAQAREVMSMIDDAGMTRDEAIRHGLQEMKKH
jgi:hypothetical protein